MHLPIHLQVRYLAPQPHRFCLPGLHHQLAFWWWETQEDVPVISMLGKEGSGRTRTRDQNQQKPLRASCFQPTKIPCPLRGQEGKKSKSVSHSSPNLTVTGVCVPCRRSLRIGWVDVVDHSIRCGKETTFAPASCTTTPCLRLLLVHCFKLVETNATPVSVFPLPALHCHPFLFRLRFGEGSLSAPLERFLVAFR